MKKLPEPEISAVSAEKALTVCANCYQHLNQRHFTTRSYQLSNQLGGLWCSTCISRKELGLPARKPFYDKPEGAVDWMVKHYQSDGDLRKWRVLFLIVGYLDNGTNDPTVREIARVSTLPIPVVMRKITALVEGGWLLVDWATDNSLTNTYQINRRCG